MHTKMNQAVARRIPVETPPHHTPFLEASSFDPRIRRDLLSRRIWREAVRRTSRVVGLISVDVLATALALTAAQRVTIGTSRGMLDAWQSYAPVIVGCTILVLAACRLYDSGEARRRYDRIVIAVVIAAAISFILGPILPESVSSLQMLSAFTLFGSALLCIGRVSADRVAGQVYRAGFLRKNTLIIGDHEEVCDILEHLRASGERQVRVVGHLAPESGIDPTAIGDLDCLGEIIEWQDVRNVIVATQLPKDRFRGLMRECFQHGTAVSLIPGTLSEFRCRVSGSNLLGLPLIELDLPRLHTVQLTFKRAVDLVGAALGIILLAPILAAIAVAIKITAPGPVLFGQFRPGLGGQPFRMLKFRTMRIDAEELLCARPALYRQFLENDCKLPLDEDPRITPIGSLLRRTSLDELPQLFNVLRGDMSLVGPRPIVGPELANYGSMKEIFLATKPGMTGYWQINGRSGVAYPERAHMDLKYIMEWSFGMDMKILLATIPAVLFGRGAH